MSNQKCNLLRTTRAPRVNTLLQNPVIPIVADKPSRPVILCIEEIRAQEVGTCGASSAETLEVNPISPFFEVACAESVGKPRENLWIQRDDNTAAAAG